MSWLIFIIVQAVVFASIWRWSALAGVFSGTLAAFSEQDLKKAEDALGDVTPTLENIRGLAILSTLLDAHRRHRSRYVAKVGVARRALNWTLARWRQVGGAS